MSSKDLELILLELIEASGAECIGDNRDGRFIVDGDLNLTEQKWLTSLDKLGDIISEITGKLIIDNCPLTSLYGRIPNVETLALKNTRFVNSLIGLDKRIKNLLLLGVNIESLEGTEHIKRLYVSKCPKLISLDGMATNPDSAKIEKCKSLGINGSIR